MLRKEEFWNAIAMCETTAYRLDLIAARDAEWQARVDELEAALDYAIACLPDAPLNAKEKLRAVLRREA